MTGATRHSPLPAPAACWPSLVIASPPLRSPPCRAPQYPRRQPRLRRPHRQIRRRRRPLPRRERCRISLSCARARYPADPRARCLVSMASPPKDRLAFGAVVVTVRRTVAGRGREGLRISRCGRVTSPATTIAGERGEAAGQPGAGEGGCMVSAKVGLGETLASLLRPRGLSARWRAASSTRSPRGWVAA